MTFIFRIDIGYEPGRGYIAVCQDVQANQTNMGKELSLRKLMRHVHEVITSREQERRRFPMESGPAIVIPNKAEKDLFGFSEPESNGE
jgi:hypothetical protein